MNKKEILEEIRHLAKAAGGVAPGKRSFEAETGIRESDWLGKHWVRWNEAITEA